MLNRAMSIALTFASPLTLATAPIVLVGATAPLQAKGQYQVSTASLGNCGADSYVNSRGNCVHRPVASRTVPTGASAQCADGTYSFSKSRRGTCSHHGGVARWL